jgi:phosphatidylglycerophosphate synthase
MNYESIGTVEDVGLSLKMPLFRTNNRNDALIACGVVLLSTFFLLDLYLCKIVTSFHEGTVLPVFRNSSSDPCEISPFCTINVKNLLLDPPNFYVHNSLSAFFVRKLDLKNSYHYVSPNMISLLHVPVALIAGTLVSRTSLMGRRLGVLLFEMRNFLDALDGAVARTRRSSMENEIMKDATGEKNNEDIVSSSNMGFYLDGICDALGMIFIYLACFFYLRKQSKRSVFAYRPLPLLMLSNSNVSIVESGGMKPAKSKWTKIITGKGSKRYVFRQIIRYVQQSGLPAIIFGLLSLFGSVAWNRYIANYTKVLERKNGSSDSQNLRNVQSSFLHSPMMWFVTFLWRYANPHAFLEILLFAIFFDKMEEFLNFARYAGLLLISFAICFTEMHLYDAQTSVAGLK